MLQLRPNTEAKTILQLTRKDKHQDKTQKQTPYCSWPISSNTTITQEHISKTVFHLTLKDQHQTKFKAALLLTQKDHPQDQTQKQDNLAADPEAATPRPNIETRRSISKPKTETRQPCSSPRSSNTKIKHRNKDYFALDPERLTPRHNTEIKTSLHLTQKD